MFYEEIYPLFDTHKSFSVIIIFILQYNKNFCEIKNEVYTKEIEIC